MTDAIAGRGARWVARRPLTSDQLDRWTSTEWFDWFADGLEIWFSAFPKADREQAFAPLRINLDREDLVQSLVKFLRRYYGSGAPARVSAAQFLDIHGRIEDAASDCIRSNLILKTAERAELLLDVFSRLKARSLPSMARLVFKTLPDDALNGQDGENLLSLIAYIIFDNSLVRKEDSFQRHFEFVLGRLENFRPALFYSLQFADSDVISCVDRFYSLASRALQVPGNDIWRVVSEELDRRFGRPAVISAIKEVSNRSIQTGGATYTAAMIPAERLKPFYPEVKTSGLWNIERRDDYDNSGAMDARAIQGSAAELEHAWT